MNQDLEIARNNFIQGMSRITDFWGFPKAMGAIYGVVYLSPTPISLDELVEQANVTKGAVSTHVRSLERLGLLHKHMALGDRKDYYTAETDFWKVIRSLLREREKNDFDRSLKAVGESLTQVQAAQIEPNEAELAQFYQQRLQNMKSFFDSIDSLVATVVALDELRLGTIQRLFGKNNP